MNADIKKYYLELERYRQETDKFSTIGCAPTDEQAIRLARSYLKFNNWTLSKGMGLRELTMLLIRESVDIHRQYIGHLVMDETRGK